MLEGMVEGALDWLRDGGVKGRYPPALPLVRLVLAGLEPDQLGLEDLLAVAGTSERVLPVLLLGGVNGRKPPWFPFPADGLMLRWVCPLPGAGVRGLPLFGELLGGVAGRYPPRFPFSTAGLVLR
jgi:hypothetical protein